MLVLCLRHYCEKEKQKKYKKRDGNEGERKLLFVLNLKLDFISKLS